MEVIQEDKSTQNHNVELNPANDDTTSSQSPLTSTQLANSLDSLDASSNSLQSATAPSKATVSSHEQKGVAENSSLPLRPVDRNWARLRQKVIRNDSQQGQSSTVLNGSTTSISDSGLKGTTKNTEGIVATNQLTDKSKVYPQLQAEGLGSGIGAGVGSSSGHTVFRNVRTFRSVVVQAQLKKMEKEIEKALYKHRNDTQQTKVRAAPKMAGTSRGARGIMTGGSYAMVAVQEPSNSDKIFIDEISEIINRWKELKLEIPCRIEILRALGKTLRADGSDPTRHLNNVLSIFSDMRRYYPQNDREDLLNVLWCLELLSPKFACRKDRIITVTQGLLRRPELMATIPLSPKNIRNLLDAVVNLSQEQNKLPHEKQDRHVKKFLSELIERIRTGDLGRGNEKSSDTELKEYKSKVACLQGLIECLQLDDCDAAHFLVYQMIPEYWIEPVSKYPFMMDGPIKALGNAASDQILAMPIMYSENSESTQSIVFELMTFIEKVLPPASLNGHISNDAVAALVKVVFAIFSAEYLEDQQQDRLSKEYTTKRDDQETTPRASISTDQDPDISSRTPPRTPLSPNVSGENFQARSLPPYVPNLVVDEKSSPVVQKARAYFNDLWNCGYQEILIYQLKDEAEEMSFRRLVNVYYRVVLGSDTSMSTPILAATLELFFSRIVHHQPEPSERLSKLLLQLSVLHKAAFYKPMMACVASDSTQFVTDYLCILSFLEMHMGVVDLYMRDPDMIAVIAMTDVGPERPRGDSQTQGLRWGSCTVGQCVIVLEFIYAIKRLARSGNSHELESGKMFLVDLERKLGMYLLSKEKKFLVPRPMRVMLSMIFFESRTLCKTIHIPGWLPRILDWAINYNGPPGIGSASNGPSGISETMRLRIKHIYNNVDSMAGEQRDRYAVKLSLNQTTDPRTGSTGFASFMSVKNRSGRLQPKRLNRMSDIGMSETAAVLRLLITVQSAINKSQYHQLLKPLWDVYCMEPHPKVSASAAFLFVKCADVNREAVNSTIMRDLKSSDSFKRTSAIERLGIIFSHRNEILEQPYVIDPSSRGPFRTANATIQVPFISSEVGSNRYTMDEPRWYTELKTIGNFPVDVRNRFQEFGWGENGRTEREMITRAQTPLMLFWTGYRDEDVEIKANFGRTYNVQKDRHATVLIPVLNYLNLSVIDLLDDRSIGVRSAAINFLSDYIRNEPVIFVRSLFAEIVKEKRPDVQKALVSRLQLLLSASSKLPPGFAFALFNHLFGLLKWYQRNSKPRGMELISMILPILAEVVSSTNDIVYKDFKRNKVDIFISNMGRFWFKSNVLPESMFPSNLSNPFDVLPRLGMPLQLFQMAMISVNQTQFMTSFLARFPSEVSNIKNKIAQFNKMPQLHNTLATDTSVIPDVGQFLPDESKVKSRFITAIPSKYQNMRELSSLRARAWLCFIINLIQRMDRNSSDRIGLVHIFDSVNAVLLEHGDDFGIVGLALDVYITAATHLRRFFASQNGYSLIFPTIFKIYCDSAKTAAVRDTIDAAFYRFYLLHQEAFVLQSLGAIVPLMLRKMCPEQSEIMSKCLYAFLEALDQPTTTQQSKALGVQSLSDPYHESSIYEGPQLEIPDWMSSFIPKDSKLFQSSKILYKREFSIADSIKLFLAVIAFDPGSVRSEQFVRVLKQILPFFLDSEPQLTTSGLDSLVEVFSKFSRSSKPLVVPSFVPPEIAPRLDQDTYSCDQSRFSLSTDPLSKNQAVKGKTWAQNDRVSIKHEFVCLIETFCDRGGQLADNQHQQMAALIRSIIKDYTSLKIPCTTEWVKSYVKNVILPVQSLRQGCQSVLYLVFQFSNILRTHYKSIDFSGFLEGLLLIVRDERNYLRRSLDLSNMIRDKIVNPALSLAIKGSWATDSPHISQAKFCNSLVDLMLSMIYNADIDTISELEQTAPGPRLMAYIIIPMCLRFRASTHSMSLSILDMQFWLRMLNLTIKAAEHDSTARKSSRMAGLLAPVLNAARVNKKPVSFDMPMPLSPHPHSIPVNPFLAPSNLPPQTPGPSRMASLVHKDEQNEDEQQQQYRGDSTMNASPGLLVDFIALRIIIVRGEKYLSYHSGCWLDIFSIIKRYFWGHSFNTGFFSGHARQNSTSGSGPPSPGLITSFPASPRTNIPLSPDSRRVGGGGLSPYPAHSRSMSEAISFFGADRTQHNVPTTALAYILWSLAETVVFNRLPLMVMMKPFLSDQLRLQDSQPQSNSTRFFKSSSSSGQNSPAFYWPSPGIPTPSQSGVGAYSSPRLSPFHQRSDSATNETLRSRDPISHKHQQREERRKQWRGWSKPEQSMSAFTVINNPTQSFMGPMSPHPSHQRQRSFVSTSENGGNMTLTPHEALQHHRNQDRHQRSEVERKPEALPLILVERANKSIENVRAMLNSTSSSTAMYSSIYPEKRTPSLNLSPSTARNPDRRDSYQFPFPDIVQDNSDQFLLPVKYERQPSSPGFGSMFLAREAALKSTDLPYSGALLPTMQTPISLAVHSTSEPTKPILRVTTSESSAIPQVKFPDENDDQSVSPSIARPTNAVGSVDQLTSLSVPLILSPPRGKKSQNILKPTINTSGLLNSESSPQTLNKAEYSPLSGSLSPNLQQTNYGVNPIRRLDSRTTDDGNSTNGELELEKHPKISEEEHEDYRLASTQARMKTFIQNIEEETRVILSCFPSVFSIGSVPAITLNVKSAEATPSVTTMPLLTPEAAGNATTVSPQTMSHMNDGASSTHQNSQAHQSPANLSIPEIRTPSITIQDQSYLAPSPINPLPSAIDGGEHLFLSERGRK